MFPCSTGASAVVGWMLKEQVYTQKAGQNSHFELLLAFLQGCQLDGQELCSQQQQHPCFTGKFPISGAALTSYTLHMQMPLPSSTGRHISRQQDLRLSYLFKRQATTPIQQPWVIPFNLLYLAALTEAEFVTSSLDLAVEGSPNKSP